MKPKVLIDIYKGLPEPLDLRIAQVISTHEALAPIFHKDGVVPLEISKRVEPPKKESDVPGEWL